MKKLLFLAVLMITGSLFAQDFEINGTIVDPEGEALESATVYIENPSDSSLVNYTISEKNGYFELSGKLNTDKMHFIVSYAGFAPYDRVLEVKPKMNLGKISMEIQDNTLDEVLIEGTRVPVTIKKDTLEFNAASFKTRDNANLEEVLKELPGVEVSSDGEITVNGTPVSQIKVNGKEFFGDDPKIATKNLPKELLNKIQVVDTKTKSEEFTGKEGASDDKTINITIDEDKNKGFFSRLTAGAGTDDRYELSGIGNYFKNDMRVSLLGSSNNINSSGFTFDEVYDAMGRNAYSISRNQNGNFSINGNSFGGGNGITRSDNAGLSFVNEWPQKTELSANYFYNRADNRTASNTERENILPNRRYYNISESNGTRLNDNHRFNISFEIQPDTLTRISVRPNIVANSGRSHNSSVTESVEDEGTPINRAATENYSEIQSMNFSNNVFFTRKFGDKGGYYNVGVGNQNNKQNQDNTFYSEREIYDEQGQLIETDIQDQLISEDNRNDSYNLNSSIRLPLTKKIMFDVSYRYEQGEETNERLVYDANTDGEYSVLNDELSNDFRSTSYNHRSSAGLVYNSEKFRASISGGYQSLRLQNQDLFTETSIDNTYDNIFTSAYLRYEIGQGKNFYASYSNSWQTPSISQLQPVINTIDPLNIIKGNPDLSPSLNHRIYANYNDYDFKTRSGFYAYFGGNWTKDQVVTRTSVDEDLVRTTTYINLDGAYNYFGGFNLDKTLELENENSLKIKGGVYGNYNRNIGFSNEEQYYSKRLSLNPSMSLEYNIGDLFRIEPFYNPQFNTAEYSLGNGREENFVTHNASLSLTSFWPERVIFGSDITYTKVGNAAPGFQDSFYLWNASLGYEILGEDGVLKLKVFDLLNQNVATQRYTGEDFIQDTQELVLEQYFMLSFTYKFSEFGGKDPNKNKSF